MARIVIPSAGIGNMENSMYAQANAMTDRAARSLLQRARPSRVVGDWNVDGVDVTRAVKTAKQFLGIGAAEVARKAKSGEELTGLMAQVAPMIPAWREAREDGLDAAEIYNVSHAADEQLMANAREYANDPKAFSDISATGTGELAKRIHNPDTRAKWVEARRTAIMQTRAKLDDEKHNRDIAVATVEAHENFKSDVHKFIIDLENGDRPDPSLLMPGFETLSMLNPEMAAKVMRTTTMQAKIAYIKGQFKVSDDKAAFLRAFQDGSLQVRGLGVDDDKMVAKMDELDLPPEARDALLAHMVGRLKDGQVANKAAIATYENDMRNATEVYKNGDIPENAQQVDDGIAAYRAHLANEGKSTRLVQEYEIAKWIKPRVSNFVKLSPDEMMDAINGLRGRELSLRESRLLVAYERKYAIIRDTSDPLQTAYDERILPMVPLDDTAGRRIQGAQLQERQRLPVAPLMTNAEAAQFEGIAGLDLAKELAGGDEAQHGAILATIAKDKPELAVLGTIDAINEPWARKIVEDISSAAEWRKLNGANLDNMPIAYDKVQDFVNKHIGKQARGTPAGARYYKGVMENIMNMAVSLTLRKHDDPTAVDMQVVDRAAALVLAGVDDTDEIYKHNGNAVLPYRLGVGRDEMARIIGDFTNGDIDGSGGAYFEGHKFDAEELRDEGIFVRAAPGRYRIFMPDDSKPSGYAPVMNAVGAPQMFRIENWGQQDDDPVPTMESVIDDIKTKLDSDNQEGLADMVKGFFDRVGKAF